MDRPDSTITPWRVGDATGPAIPSIATDPQGRTLFNKFFSLRAVMLILLQVSIRGPLAGLGLIKPNRLTGPFLNYM